MLEWGGRRAAGSGPPSQFRASTVRRPPGKDGLSSSHAQQHPPFPAPPRETTPLASNGRRLRGGAGQTEAPGSKFQPPACGLPGHHLLAESQAVERAGLASAPVPALCPASRESSSSCGDAAGRRRCAEGGVCERTLVCVWVCVQVQRGPVHASGARIRAGVVHAVDSGLGVEPCLACRPRRRSPTPIPQRSTQAPELIPTFTLSPG